MFLRGFILVLCLAAAVFAQQATLSGKVEAADTGEPLTGAILQIQGTQMGAAADDAGGFQMANLPPGEYRLIVQLIGYKTEERELKLAAGERLVLTIRLQPSPLLGKEVLVVATRAVAGESPVAFSTLTQTEIRKNYFAQDMPVLLSDLPSSTFYSESGTGIGYNYLSIRGFGQRRISVMINGIPQNDPEDHNVYWVDFPDLLGNVEDVQVQRGAGSAFYGPAAIGGSVNIITSQFSPLREVSAYAGAGSYNTRKYSASVNSGLMNGRFALFGRFSRITSDGYRDRSWVDFKSYFLGAAWFTKNSSTRLHFYGGPIEDHLAFYGISKEAALKRETRRQNPIQRPDEIENFNQPHLELVHSLKLNSKLTLNNTLFGIRGYGFFDYDGSWAPLSYYRLTPQYGFDVKGNPEDLYPNSLLIRAYVDNKQIGWLPQVQYNGGRLNLTAGGEFRLHRSLHWGRIQKGKGLPLASGGGYIGLNYIGNRRYYEYRGAKDILSPYLHSTYQLSPQVQLMGDLQLAYLKYRLYDEKFIGTDFTLTYLFLNPRVGINFKLQPGLSLYASLSRTSREPRLKNFYDAAEASTPTAWGPVTPHFTLLPNGRYNFDDPLVKPETLNDFEVGLHFQRERLEGSVNLFYMDFRDEIIKKGQLDRFGQPVTGNADRTLHSGLEIDLRGKFLPWLQATGNFTVSDNRLKKYYDYSGGKRLDLSNNQIAGFPGTLGNLRLLLDWHKLTASLQLKYVGKQFTDNYETDENSVDAYTEVNGYLGYALTRLDGLSRLEFRIHLRNLLDSLYILHGEGDEFFPAAGRQAFFSLRVEI